MSAVRRPDGTCWTCAKPRCFGWLGHMAGRLRWAAKTARHARPRSSAARLRLLWHDFVIHGLLHKGGERCQDCGRGYEEWRAWDTQWRQVMGDGGGLLCRSCWDEAWNALLACTPEMGLYLDGTLDETGSET